MALPHSRQRLFLAISLHHLSLKKSKTHHPSRHLQRRVVNLYQTKVKGNLAQTASLLLLPVVTPPVGRTVAGADAYVVESSR